MKITVKLNVPNVCMGRIFKCRFCYELDPMNSIVGTATRCILFDTVTNNKKPCPACLAARKDAEGK